MADACWRTLDGRQIPIRFMTTTHLGNAMTHQTRIFGKPYEPLLEEWIRRESEGVLPKAYRCFCRVLGNYYKGSAKFTTKKKEAFNKLNDELVKQKKQAMFEFDNAVAI